MPAASVRARSYVRIELAKALSGLLGKEGVEVNLLDAVGLAALFDDGQHLDMPVKVFGDGFPVPGKFALRRACSARCAAPDDRPAQSARVGEALGPATPPVGGGPNPAGPARRRGYAGEASATPRMARAKHKDKSIVIALRPRCAAPASLPAGRCRKRRNVPGPYTTHGPRTTRI